MLVCFVPCVLYTVVSYSRLAVYSPAGRHVLSLFHVEIAFPRQFAYADGGE